MLFRSRHPRALLAYAALLDHSVRRIAEVSADAREFDREEIYRLTDVWDNNTTALFTAAAARFRPRARPTVRALPARLALVLYRLPSTPVEYSHPAYARLTFAQPSANDPDGPWTLRSRGFEHPVALAFTLDAFRCTAVPESTPDRLAFGPHLTATGLPDPC
ncbi:hypothetical protein [Kitasatospora cineracea]|uniref:hypothetical protein n=1 Tax=Kitasatospora cineracea TaxID=88074 RepID=UPI0038254723